jgi:cullin 1
MLTDLEFADIESKKFIAHCDENKIVNSLEFNVTILTTSYWPTYKTFELTIPRELEGCIKSFNDYYQKKFHHRVL